MANTVNDAGSHVSMSKQSIQIFLEFEFDCPDDNYDDEGDRLEAHLRAATYPEGFTLKAVE